MTIWVFGGSPDPTRLRSMFFGPDEGVTTRDAGSAFATEVVKAAAKLSTLRSKNEIAKIANLLFEPTGTFAN